MGLSGDAKVHLEIDGNVVRLEPLSRRVLRAQELYRQAVKNPRTVDDFLRDRHEEADHDERESEANRPATSQVEDDKSDTVAASVTGPAWRWGCS